MSKEGSPEQMKESLRSKIAEAAGEITDLEARQSRLLKRVESTDADDRPFVSDEIRRLEKKRHDLSAAKEANKVLLTAIEAGERLTIVESMQRELDDLLTDDEQFIEQIDTLLTGLRDAVDARDEILKDLRLMEDRLEDLSGGWRGLVRRGGTLLDPRDRINRLRTVLSWTLRDTSLSRLVRTGRMIPYRENDKSYAAGENAVNATLRERFAAEIDRLKKQISKSKEVA